MAPLLSNVKAIIEKIPYSINIYHYFKYSFPYLLYFKPKELPIQGSKMYLDVNEPDKDLRKTFRVYAKNCIHEPTTTHLFEQLLNPGDIYCDLGANIGYFSLLASRLVGPNGKVFSFEPESRNFKFLSRNKEINNYTQMNPVNKAVSTEKGVTQLYICPYDTGHHTIQQLNGITSYETNEQFNKDKIDFIEIETISLDEFLNEKNIDHIDMIKMDVEGAECLAVAGMPETLTKNNNLIFVMEFFPLLIEKMGGTPADLLRKMTEEYNFEMYEIVDDYNASTMDNNSLKKITDFSNILEEYKNDKMFHINILFIKKQHDHYERIIEIKQPQTA